MAKQQALHEKVWGFVRFHELSPEAAANALKNDCLFSKQSACINYMDPMADPNLYRPDGSLTTLTVQERNQQFPR